VHSVEGQLVTRPTAAATHLDAGGSCVAEHVGRVPWGTGADVAAPQLVQQHAGLHTQLERGHQQQQLRPFEVLREQLWWVVQLT
jgi:hypothetical protein